jgi:hypothetical protein
LGRTDDGSTTTASSWECSLEIVEVPKRETAVASFFGLSSSLKRSHFDINKKEKN